MKIGLSLKINVADIDKDRLHKGKKGLYLDLTTFVDLDQQDQYGNNGFVTQSKEKDEDVKMPILGNARVFWKGAQRSSGGPAQQPSGAQSEPDFDGDIPF